MQGRQLWECIQEQQRLDYTAKVKIVGDREERNKREREPPTNGDGTAKQAKTLSYPSLSPKPPEQQWSQEMEIWHAPPNYNEEANRFLQQ